MASQKAISKTNNIARAGRAATPARAARAAARKTPAIKRGGVLGKARRAAKRRAAKVAPPAAEFEAALPGVVFSKPRPKKLTEAETRERIFHDAEVEANSRIFHEILLPKLLKKHRDKFALMKRGEVVGIFSDPCQAGDEGRKRYGELFFSVQKITDKPIRLGIFSG